MGTLSYLVGWLLIPVLAALLRNNEGLRWIFLRAGLFLGDRLFNSINYYYIHAKYSLPSPTIEWRHPKRFNHKLIWLKIRYRHPNAALYADKIAVKRFVSKTFSDDIVIPTLGVWSNADDIDYATLPDSFVLKPNHGSGWVIPVAHQSSIDREATNKQLNRWLRMNYFHVGREYQYDRIQPRILAESMLVPGGGQSLLDYKFFCFHGEPRLIQVDFDRLTNHSRNFYDLDWQRMPFSYLYPEHDGDPPRPLNLDIMIAIARSLARDFPFIRVDLYDCDGRIYFGELTFHPGGGFEPIIPDEWDEKLGDLLTLPEIEQL